MLTSSGGSEEILLSERSSSVREFKSFIPCSQVKYNKVRLRSKASRNLWIETAMWHHSLCYKFLQLGLYAKNRHLVQGTVRRRCVCGCIDKRAASLFLKLDKRYYLRN